MTTHRAASKCSVMVGGAEIWLIRIHLTSHARTVVALVHDLVAGLPSPVRFLVGSGPRLLILGWLVGVLMLGTTRVYADGIFAHPPYVDTQATLFEAYDPFAYKLSVIPGEDATDGWFNFSGIVYEIVGMLNNLLLWLGLGLLYGALTLLEWFLSLTLYSDTASQVDQAVASMAAQVFWPLFTATLAIGAIVVYTRYTATGNSFLSDIAWMIAAATLAIGFVQQPSQIFNEVDHLRQQLATNIITGADSFTTPDGTGVTGYPEPTLTGPDTETASRTLVTGLWDSFGATPWCIAQFHDLTLCNQYGHQALANNDTWQDISRRLAEDEEIPEFGGNRAWIQGIDLGRIGYVMVLDLVTIPMAIMLLVLLITGLTLIVGLLLRLVLGFLFLVGIPIPGWFRQLAVKWWVGTLGVELQLLFISAALAGVTVVSAIIATHVDTYGFLIVALLNLALIISAVHLRAWLDTIINTTAGGGGGGSGLLGTLAAYGAVRAAGWAAHKAGHLAGTGARILGRTPSAAKNYGKDVAQRLDGVGQWDRNPTPHLPKRNNPLAALDTGQPVRTIEPHYNAAPNTAGPEGQGSGPGRKSGIESGGQDRLRWRKLLSQRTPHPSVNQNPEPTPAAGALGSGPSLPESRQGTSSTPAASRRGSHSARERIGKLLPGKQQPAPAIPGNGPPLAASNTASIPSDARAGEPKPVMKIRYPSGPGPHIQSFADEPRSVAPASKPSGEPSSSSAATDANKKVPVPVSSSRSTGRRSRRRTPALDSPSPPKPSTPEPPDTSGHPRPEDL